MIKLTTLLKEKQASELIVLKVTTPVIVDKQPTTTASMEETLTPVKEIESQDLKVQDVVRKNVDVLLTICSLYGFVTEGYSPSNTYAHYSKILKEYKGNVMKMFKDKLAAFRAYHKQQPLPSCMGPKNLFGAGFLFGGRCHRWMRILKRDDPELFDSLIISLCQAKKGMERPTKTQVNQSLVDTFRTLTGPKVQPPTGTESLRSWGDVTNESPLISDYLDYKSCKFQLERTVDEIFENEEYTDMDRYKPYFPSSSADYNNTRSTYGIVGHFIELIHREHSAGNISEELFRSLKSTHPLINLVDEGGFRKVPILDETELYRQYKSLYDLCLDLALSESPETKLVGLAEALKVRVISKGPPFHYFVLKPLQKKLWNVMKRMKVFRFIGKTVSDDDVQDILGSKLKPEEFYLSVDYSDATNQIRSWASDIVIERLCKKLKLDEQERKLFLESMTQHIMFPPSFKEKEKMFLDLEGLSDSPLNQQNGQLMGSIVSFPILCIINATILRWTQEVAYQQPKKLDYCNITVNGDDGLLKTTVAGRDVWEKISPYMGLKPSLGKVFFSKTFLDINSTNYSYDPEGYEGILDEHGKYITYPVYDKVIASHAPGFKPRYNKDAPLHGPLRLVGYVGKLRHFRATKYVNAGLLFGVPRSQVKVSAKDDSSKEKSFGAVARELVHKAPEFLRSRLLDKFKEVNAKFLKSATDCGIPWYVPEDYGGLGLPILGGHHAPSELDRRLMRKFWLNRHRFQLPARPKYSWRVWDYVAKRLKELLITSYGTLYAQEYGASSEEDHTVSQLEGLLAIESLFTVGKAILPEHNKKQKSYMPLLGRFNKKLLHDKEPLPEPFSLTREFPVMKAQTPARVILIAAEKIEAFPQVKEKMKYFLASRC